jgi:4-carboxymuconolactone decarboxylase
LDNGVRPAKISEIITHLAFYSGWGAAMSAAAVAQPIFTQHSVAPTSLPGAAVAFPEIDENAEAQRAAMAEQSAGKVAPGHVQFTTDALFKDLWLSPGWSRGTVVWLPSALWPPPAISSKLLTTLIERWITV